MRQVRGQGSGGSSGRRHSGMSRGGKFVPTLVLALALWWHVTYRVGVEGPAQLVLETVRGAWKRGWRVGSSANAENQLPWWCLIALGSYALFTVGYNVITFPECDGAYESLRAEITEAQAYMKKHQIG